MTESKIIRRAKQLVKAENLERVEIVKAYEGGEMLDSPSGLGFWLYSIEALLTKKQGLFGTKYRRTEKLRDTSRGIQVDEQAEAYSQLRRKLKSYLGGLSPDVEVVGLENL